MRSVEDWENEWALIEVDLEEIAAGQEIQKRKSWIKRSQSGKTDLVWGKT